MGNWLQLATAALVLLVGCTAGGQETTSAPSADGLVPKASPSPSPNPSVSWGDLAGPSKPRKPAEPAECADDPVAIGFSEISQSIKWRSIEISVKNCTDELLPIQAPVVTGVDAAGNESVLSDFLRREGSPMEKLKDPLVAVEPGQDSRVFMFWRSDASCEEGVREIVVNSMGVEHRREDCFELSSFEANDENQLIYHWGNRKSER